VGQPRFPPSSRAGGRAPRRSRVPLLMVVLAALLLGTIGYVALLAPRLWQSYTDPVLGFSFRYPPGWLLTTNADGSHPTVIDAATRATITVDAETETGSPQTLLADGLPSTATSLRHRQVAGVDAIDFMVPGAQAGGSTAPDPGQLQRLHMVVLAVRNSVGTTNQYTLALATPPGTSASADEIFEQVAGTFSPGTPPGFSLPFVSQGGPPRPIPGQTSQNQPCNSICWAEANWDVADFTADAGGQDCAAYDDTTSQYVNCSSRTLATIGDFQPGYQCSEFVARALAQDGLLPGLDSGGVEGTSAGAANSTAEFGTYSYNSYPFTRAADASSGSGDTLYNLLGVGTPGTPGLYDYLLNSGIGVSIHQDLAHAVPGDVVFFYTPSLDPSNREHVMLITSLARYQSAGLGLGGYDALLDGHNRAAYHSLLSTLVSAEYPFEIIHLVAQRSIDRKFTTTGSSWATGSDDNGEPLVYTGTTSSSLPTATAKVSLESSGHACTLAVYIPDVDATALASFQITLSGSKGGQPTVQVDESQVDGWVLLLGWNPPGTGSPPTQVVVGNNTGSDVDLLGLGPLVALC
jgi:hypothetical protein